MQVHVDHLRKDNSNWRVKLVNFDSEEKNIAQISNEPIRNKREIPLACKQSTQ